ncbi:hypothetical protein MKX03_008807 [Papaver bracteatum]|nr:hypothetical protein MKX03_008807 [Papaver bracteatum]
MSKAHLNFLSLGFLLVLAFSEIRYACSADNICVGKKKIPVRNDCFHDAGCGALCRQHNFKGPSRCIETIIGISHYSSYECECCKCAAKISLMVNSCNNPHVCVERCILEAGESGLYGPSECREFYDESGKYVHKCYCCDEGKKLPAGDSVAVA